VDTKGNIIVEIANGIRLISKVNLIGLCGHYKHIMVYIADGIGLMSKVNITGLCGHCRQYHGGHC